MMEIISDNERRENLISQFNEFLEYVSWEFGSEIDCHQLVSSIEYVELFEHMYSQVCDYCSAETNDKIADLVSTIEDSDSITFDEVESAIIEICNMIENISYRHSMNIDNDIYVEKQFALPGGSIKYGRRNSTDAVTPNVDEDDEEEKDSRDADALIEYVKSVTENNEISWFETDMIDKISTNFALNSLNMNPQIKNKVDDDDVIRTRTIFASFDYDMHIVPGVDDGSLNMSMSLDMLEIAYEQGVRDVFCTSHNVYSEDEITRYKSQFMMLQMMAKSRFKDLKLHMGCELLCAGEYIEDILYGLEIGVFLPLGNSKYVLTEL